MSNYRHRRLGPRIIRESADSLNWHLVNRVSSRLVKIHNFRPFRGSFPTIKLPITPGRRRLGETWQDHRYHKSRILIIDPLYRRNRVRLFEHATALIKSIQSPRKKKASLASLRADERARTLLFESLGTCFFIFIVFFFFYYYFKYSIFIAGDKTYRTLYVPRIKDWELRSPDAPKTRDLYLQNLQRNDLTDVTRKLAIVVPLLSLSPSLSLPRAEN